MKFRMSAKRRTLLALAMAIFAVAGAGCFAVPGQEDFQAGMEAFKKRDFDTALKKWKPLAEQGDKSAQTNLGVLYYQGLGVRKDYAEAFKWYQLAAMQGYAEGEFNLGVAFAEGHGTGQDLREARKWYEFAAKQGYGPAQLMLAEMYYRGTGVGVDYETAAKWYREAADGGEPMAAHILGTLYITGQGVQKDPVQAYVWFSVAASEATSQTGKNNALKIREMVAKGMTPAQKTEADRKVMEWKPKTDEARK